MSVAAATAALSAVQTPDGWCLVRLCDVSAIRREQVKPHDGDSRPFVGLENMNSGGALNGHSTAGESISNKTVFFEGDTLYGKLRPNLRKVVRADFDGVCSTDILAIYANERLTGSFLNHLVRSDLLHNHAMRGVTGTRMPRTSWSHLRSFRLFLPPRSEQRAIAAVLDSIDEAIERTEEVIAATERLRDSLLHELLTRGLPGQHSEWKEVPGLGTIPASWKVVRLGDVAEVSFSSVDKKTVDGEIPVRLCNYTDVFYNRQVCAEMPFMEATASPTECQRWSLREGDVLFTKDSETVDEIGRIANGITRFGLTLGATRALRLLLPPVVEQWAIAAVLDGVDASIERAREERSNLAVTATSVTDALLTGRVRVDQRA